MDRPSRPGDGTALSVELMHRQNRVAEENSAIRRKTTAPFPQQGQAAPPLPLIFKAKEIETLNPMAKPDDEEAIHVQEILLENVIAEERSGWGRIKFWKRRKSKRTRDFIVLVGGLDLAIALVMKMEPDVITAVYGISAITLVTSFIGWIMFVVMDDY